MGIKDNRAIWEADKSGPEFLYTTIGEIMDKQAETNPEKLALVYSYPELGINLRLNFAQYRAQVNQVAKGLMALGVQKGEHVAVWSPNLPQWIFLQLALAKIGGVMVTVNTLYKASEIEYILRQGDVSHLFMVEEVRGNSYLDSIYSIVPEIKNISDPLTETLQSERLPKLKRVCLLNQTPRPGIMLFSQMLTLAATVSDEALAERQASVTYEDVAVIMYTSGTTGFPKGAMLTHYNILNTMIMNGRGQDFSQDRYVSPMPLFHVAGANFVIWTLLNGIPMIPLIAFDPVKLLELIAQERGTVSFCVPTMLIAMLNHPRFLAGEFDLSSLRLVYSGGTTVPVAVLQQVKEKMGADVGILFGMTESTGAGTGTLIEDTFENKAATVGQAYPRLDAKVIDPVTGEAVGVGEQGELCLRGFSVMKGYYNMPEKTAETIDHENWLHTGDLATMNAEGYFKIVGRVKDMVIRGGENIYPAEIEQFLMRHPAIAEAQIVGVPDPFMGEETVALLRVKPGASVSEDEVREYCRTNLAKYKNPKYLKLVEEFPLTASGKVKKFELRAMLIKELNLEDPAQVKL